MTRIFLANAEFALEWGIGNLVDVAHPLVPRIDFDNVTLDAGEFFRQFVVRFYG